MTIPAHPHRTHSSQRSRKRKRYKPRPAVSIRKEMEPVPQTAEKPVQPELPDNRSRTRVIKVKDRMFC